jgi:hypothetical protein
MEIRQDDNSTGTQNRYKEPRVHVQVIRVRVADPGSGQHALQQVVIAECSWGVGWACYRSIPAKARGCDCARVEARGGRYDLVQGGKEPVKDCDHFLLTRY